MAGRMVKDDRIKGEKARGFITEDDLVDRLG